MNKMGLGIFNKIKIPNDPEGRGIFNPPTGNENRGRASRYYTQLQEIKLYLFKPFFKKVLNAK